MPFRLVTNTTSRSRAALVDRLTGYGFDARAEEVFTATLSGVSLLRAAGITRSRRSSPPGALEDMSGLALSGGTSGVPSAGPADAVVVGDLGERWTYALLQEAFEHLLSGAALVALSRDRYWRQGDRLASTPGPSSLPSSSPAENRRPSQASRARRSSKRR